MIINQQALQAIYVNLLTTFNERFEIKDTFWEKVATEVPSTGKLNDYKWLGEFPMLREWIGEREIMNLAAKEYVIRNKAYESTIGVFREDIEDDNLGVYVPIVQNMADQVKLHRDKLVFEALVAGFTESCYDGQSFFSASHPVGDTTYSNLQTGAENPWFLMDTTQSLKPIIYQHRKDPEFTSLDNPTDYNVFFHKQFYYGVDYRGAVGYAFWQQCLGSKKELTATNYAAGRQTMMTYKNGEGVPLNIKPNLLVVGPSNEENARRILEVDRIYDTSGEGSWVENLWRGSAEMLVVPWLD